PQPSGADRPAKRAAVPGEPLGATRPVRSRDDLRRGERVLRSPPPRPLVPPPGVAARRAVEGLVRPTRLIQGWVRGVPRPATIGSRPCERLYGPHASRRAPFPGAWPTLTKEGRGEHPRTFDEGRHLMPVKQTHSPRPSFVPHSGRATLRR